MDLAALIARYGYAVVFAGTLFEGETVLLAAGYAAHRGYLDGVAVALVACLGATLGDQLWFALGRWQGARLLARWPALNRRMDGALGWIARHPDLSIVSMRFVWGLRIALPLALGMSRVSWRRFAVLNVLSAAVWAALVTAAGWSFGALLTRYAPAWHRYEHEAFAGIIVIALLIHALRRWRERARSRTLRP